jgi:hypothetical protein
MMQTEFYRDKYGNPISVESWALLIENREYSTVGETTVGGLDVSTVWIGLDNAHFETMVFDQESNSLEQYTQRYDTLAEARKGHEGVVERVKADLAKEVTDRELDELELKGI